MNKKTLLLTLLFAALFGAVRAEEVTIGNLTNASENGLLPMYFMYNYSYSQQIYTAAEIGTSGTINSITMWLRGSADIPTLSLDIYMVESNKNSFSDNTDWVSMNSTNKVYSGSVTVHNTEVQAFTFTLNTPFQYRGTGNLLIAVNNKTGRWGSGLVGMVFNGNSGDPNRTLIAYRDSGNAYDPANPSFSGYTKNFRNVVSLNFSGGGSSSGNQLTVNEGTQTNGYVPIYGYWAEYYTKSQFIIPANQLTAMANSTISKMTFYSSDNNKEWGNAQFNVYLKEVSNTTFSDATFLDWNSMSLVYSGSLSVSNNTMEVTFANGYPYSGGNLLVGFRQTQTGRYSSVSWYGVAANNAAIGGWENTREQHTVQSFLPKTTFDYSGGSVSDPCPAPSGLAVTLTPGDGTVATLSWTENGDATSWTISGTIGGTTAYEIEVTENPYTMTSLTPETPYTASVRANCSASSHSSGTSPVSFTPTDAYLLTVNDGTATNTYVPIYGLYVDEYSKCQFIIPANQLTAMANSTVNSMTFYANVANKNWGNAQFNVYLKEVSNTTFSSATLVDWNSMSLVYSGSVFVSDYRMEITFDNDFQYSGGNLMVGFKQTVSGTFATCGWYGVVAAGAAVAGYENNGNDIISLQSFLPKTTFGYDPTCLTPTDLNVTNVLTDQATITWTSDAAAWEIQLGENAAISVTGPTYTFTGLTAGTAYTVKVRTNCGGMYSDWAYFTFMTDGYCPENMVCIGTGNATNLNIPIFPYYNYSMTQQIYTAAEIGQTGTIVCVDFYMKSTSSNICTRNLDIYMVSTEKETFSGPTDWIAVTASDRVYSGRVTFAPDCWTSIDLNVPFFHDGTTNVALIVDDYTDSYGYPQRFYVFDAPSQAIYVQNNDSNIDPFAPDNYTGTVMDVKNRVRFGMVCPNPTELTVSNVLTDQATVSWTSDATAWQIQLDGNEAIDVTEPTYTFSGLTAGTNYYVKVRTNCGGVYSDWASATFKTICPEGMACIGTGTDIIGSLPTRTDVNYALTQQIYTASEIGQAGAITSVDFHVTFCVDNSTTRNLDIYMVSTEKETFSDNNDWIAVTANDRVYSGSVTFTAGGWTTIEFDVPFIYDGNTNIALIVDDNTGNSLAADMHTRTFHAEKQTYAVYRNDYNINPFALDYIPDDYLGIVRYDVKNQVRFGITTPCLTPTDVTITDITYNSAVVSWVSDGDIELQYAENIWMHYDNNVYAGSIGYGTEGERLTWGSMFPADMLTSNNLTQVALYELASNNVNDITVIIYQGGETAPETQLYTETFAPIGADGWHKVTLATPVTIDPSQNLWVVFSADDAYPIQCCADVGTVNNRWTSSDNGEWDDCANYISNRSWMIRAYLENPEVEWVTIDNAASPQAIPSLTPETEYSVKVRANCGGGNYSDWSNPVSFTTLEICPTPKGLAASEVGIFNANLSWTGSQDNYNLDYRTSMQIDRYFYEDFSGESIAFRIHNFGEANNDFGYASGWYDFTDGTSGIIFFPDTELTSPQYLISYEMDPVGEGAILELAIGSDGGECTYRVGFSSTDNSISSFSWSEETVVPDDLYYVNYDVPEGTKYFAIAYPETNPIDAYTYVVRFLVYANYVPAGDWITVENVTSPYVLNGLSPDTKYDWSVRGVNCDGNGTNTEWSYNSTFTTDKAYYWNDPATWTDHTVPADYADVTIPANTTVVIPSGYTAYADEITLEEGASIIIEDGGELYHNSETSVTMQIHYLPNSSGTKDGEYGNYRLIASPITPNLAVESPGLIASGEYDLYRFAQDQPGEEWRNHKAGEFSDLNWSEGYLYANTQRVTASFAGSTFPTVSTHRSLAYSADVPGPGWNLMGNIYTCKAYISSDADNNNPMPYYVLNPEGTEVVAATTGAPILPMQGFFVQATAPGQKVYYHTTAPAVQSSLNITVDQGQDTKDNAILCFGEGNNLDKLQLNPNHTKVYIAQDGKDYAVVNVGRDGVHTVSTDVNFKAEQDGTYTLNFSGERVEFSHLHLIDKLTGEDVDLLSALRQAQEPQGPATYTFKAKATDKVERFKLVFSTK